MKIGTFYEHQLPRPWKADSELRLFQDALEQVELADRRLGPVVERAMKCKPEPKIPPADGPTIIPAGMLP
jgi:hypothetical protein